MSAEATATKVKPKKEFKGDLAQQEQRLAYWLLLPTLIVILLIAVFPLGSVFYASVTDKQFASASEVNFAFSDSK